MTPVVHNTYIDNSRSGGYGYGPGYIAPVVIVEDDRPTRYNDDRGYGSGGYQAPAPSNDGPGVSDSGSFADSDNGTTDSSSFASVDNGVSDSGSFS